MLQRALGYSYEETELIDTLWNVNKHWFKGFLDSDAELIDTLWNVNSTRLEKESQR